MISNQVEYILKESYNSGRGEDWGILSHVIPYARLNMKDYIVRINDTLYVHLTDSGFEDAYNKAQMWMVLHENRNS